MYINNSVNAKKTLSFRTDAEMYQAMQDLAKLLYTKPSSLMRLAIADLLDTARDLHPATFGDLRKTYGI
jgi:predicted transcriptional regulator